jgi:epoxide hydrolase-like predicted phosphatase
LKFGTAKNLIFDLGGVIIDLNAERTKEAFATLSQKSVREIHLLIENSPVFLQYEKGILNDWEFRTSVRNLLHIKASDLEIDTAWNAMLGDIPLSRIRLLESLREDYRLFLLSNTNNIHLVCFNEIVKAACGSLSLDPYFDRTYYSHRLKMRKPDTEIYALVLGENKLLAQETLFLDDNASNLEGAAQLGIQTFHVQNPDMIFSLFHESKT